MLTITNANVHFTETAQVQYYYKLYFILVIDIDLHKKHFTKNLPVQQGVSRAVDSCASREVTLLTTDYTDR